MKSFLWCLVFFNELNLYRTVRSFVVPKISLFLTNTIFDAVLSEVNTLTWFHIQFGSIVSYVFWTLLTENIVVIRVAESES